MTSHEKQPDIVEQLREAIREGAGQLAEDCVEEITRLRSRLEMDGVWQLIDGKMQRISVEPGSIPDGIECRDETIKLQDAEIARLRLRSPAPAEGIIRGDSCTVPGCQRKNVPGNENVIDGRLVCDDCHAAMRSPAPAEDGDRQFGQPHHGHDDPDMATQRYIYLLAENEREINRLHADGEGLREALKQIALITASGRTTELLAKMAQVNALARAALSSGRDGRKT